MLVNSITKQRGHKDITNKNHLSSLHNYKINIPKFIIHEVARGRVHQLLLALPMHDVRVLGT